MGDDNTGSKKRKLKHETSYGTMTIEQVEDRLDFKLYSLTEVPVMEILAGATEGPDSLLRRTKEAVYKEIVRYLRVFGNPMDMDPNFKEVNAVLLASYQQLMNLYWKLAMNISDFRAREIFSLWMSKQWVL